MKDGNDAPFRMRAKDVSTAQDGSLQAVRHLSTPYPVDYGIGGCYQAVAATGVIAAGASAGATVFAFRNPSSSLSAIIRRIRLNGFTNAAGFTSGILTFSAIAARTFTAFDTGGTTISTSTGKLRSAMPSSSAAVMVANTTALTPGTRTLDASPFARMDLAAPTTATTTFAVQASQSLDGLFSRAVDEHPLLLGLNEGFVIQATVPATGTWSCVLTVAWDEVPLVNY
ncbi:hypothetical protein [Bradyrhizobium sp. S3.7.6]